MVVRLRVLVTGEVGVGVPKERRDFLRPLSQSEPVSSRIPGGMAKPGASVEEWGFRVGFDFGGDADGDWFRGMLVLLFVYVRVRKGGEGVTFPVVEERARAGMCTSGVGGNISSFSLSFSFTGSGDLFFCASAHALIWPLA